ncbi:MAG: tetratricopeptide repeat protein [Acetobacterales bacterium]
MTVGTAMAGGRRARRAVRARQRPDSLHRALEAHRAGRLDHAERDYRRALKADPDDADALHLLGVLLHQLGRTGEGVPLLERSVEQAPENPTFAADLAQVLLDVGKRSRSRETLERARKALERACKQRPAHLPLLAGLGECLVLLQDWADAERRFRAALRVSPDEPQILNNLGYVLYELDELDEAHAVLERVLTRMPSLAAAHANLGRIAERRRDRRGAIAHYRRAIEVSPGYLVGRQLLGAALLADGDTDGARAALEPAVAASGACVDIVAALGMVEFRAGRLELAADLLRRALDLEQRDTSLHAGLASVLRASGVVSEARRRYDVAADWGHLARDARMGAAASLLDGGDADGAVARYRSVASLHADDPAVASALLMAEQYLPDIDRATLFRHHSYWRQRFAPRVAGTRYANPPDPDRRLRIGYLSPDFRRHSVPFFVESVFAAHDREAVEIVAYSTAEGSDAVTDTLRGRCDLWRAAAGLVPADLAAMVEADGIDIAVDLAGHTPGNALLALARRPAPVQMTWIGYPDTTGLDAIDWRITDGICDPAPQADDYHAECVLRLDPCFLCYAPPAAAPAVAVRDPSGPPVFGCFSNFAKVGSGLIDLWAHVLRSVPDARLVLKSRPLADAELRAVVTERFEAAGVAADRVELRTQAPGLIAHLAQYADIDIALDTHPYSGTTTTCEALWMGVPVVTLAGERHASRVGASLLGVLGLDELVAGSPESYVATAVALVRDRKRLATLRAGLRARMATSPLVDAPGFTRRLEAAYRMAWGRYCKDPAAGRERQ